MSNKDALKEFNGILGSLYSADGLDFELADWCRTNKDIIRKALQSKEPAYKAMCLKLAANLEEAIDLSDYGVLPCKNYQADLDEFEAMQKENSDE